MQARVTFEDGMLVSEIFNLFHWLGKYIREAIKTDLSTTVNVLTVTASG